jgi:hypothetical protein
MRVFELRSRDRFAKLRGRRNIRNLYIHLCWQTVEQQFNPSLAIESAVNTKSARPDKHNL